MKKHNRRYKDSVFVDLFGEDKDAKKNFLSLYNALHGSIWTVRPNSSRCDLTTSCT